MTRQSDMERQARIKSRLRARGFSKEAEYFELILAIQELIEQETEKQPPDG